MADLLVRLYDLPEFEATARVAAAGIAIRRALPPERYFILEWIREHFQEIWAGEAAAALSRMPVTLWVPTFSGNAQACLPRAMRLRSHATRRVASDGGSRAANSGMPGLK